MRYLFVPWTLTVELLAALQRRTSDFYQKLDPLLNKKNYL